MNRTLLATARLGYGVAGVWRPRFTGRGAVLHHAAPRREQGAPRHHRAGGGNQRSVPPPAWFLPGLTRMRGGAARWFA